jgi:hypothetical protein
MGETVKIDIADLLQRRGHPKLLADKEDISRAKERIERYPWYARLYEKKKAEVDTFLQRPIYISPLKQAYEYPNYDCIKHNVQLKYEDDRPFEHRCPVDGEVFTGEKYDAAWAGWYHGLLSRRLVSIGTVYQISGDERYAEAARDVLVRFADTYGQYPNRNNILGPARIFFGTLGESIFGTHVALGYDLVYESPCFSTRDHQRIRDQFLLPLAELATQFDETVSNRQTWYNNAVASIGFATNTAELLEWAFNGRRGFLYQLTSGLPKSGLWYEGPGYHFFTLEGFILLAEMARHHGLDLYQLEIAGHSIRKMFDAPLNFLAPDFTFPRIKDSGGGSLFHPEKISKYEVGYARYGDERYGQVLKYAYEQEKIERALEFFFVFNPNLPEVQTPIYPAASINLEGNGCAILRDNVDEDEKFLYLDYGIVGGEHGHPDRLSIGYYSCGQHWILDPLNQDYFKPNLQTWFRQSIAHNTVVLNESNQAWANGHLNFFGDTLGLKVASGYADKLYGGAFIRRTVALLGNYFIDVCEVDAQDERVIDYPIHSFGKLRVDGSVLERKPDDLFGKPQGIPGYDQFTDILNGTTDGSWKADFRLEDAGGLAVFVLESPESQVFSVMTPGIREDYEKRLPMVFCRRRARQTKFVSLLEAYRDRPRVSWFGKRADDTYEILLDNEQHIVHIDPEENSYWCLTYSSQRLARMSVLSEQKIVWDGKTLLDSLQKIKKLDIVVSDGEVEILGTDDFVELRLNLPDVRRVKANGKVKNFRVAGESIVVSPSDESSLKYLGEETIVIFEGVENTVNLAIGNPSGTEVVAEVKLTLRPHWREAVEAQANDWGGVVNLPALHKNTILKRIVPETLAISGTWLSTVPSCKLLLPARGHCNYTLQLKPPCELQPASYPASLSIGEHVRNLDVAISEPVALEYFLPNGQGERLRVRLVNHTDAARVVSVTICPQKPWKSEETRWEARLLPKEKKVFDVSLKHEGYLRGHQTSPIEVELHCEEFIRRWRKDFSVGYCFRASTPPALDGTWKNWTTSSPLLIENEDQISRLLFGNQPWRGVDDLSAKVYAMFDEAYLYVRAEVNDDVVWTNVDVRSQMPSDADSIEIILDLRENGEQGQDPPTSGVFHHVAVPGIPTIQFDEHTKGDVPIRFRQIKDAETFWRRTEKGYDIIVRIAWQSLGVGTPEPGMKIGFDLALNDNDGARFRTNQMLWAGFNQNQSWLDLSLIGALILKESV